MTTKTLRITYRDETLEQAGRDALASAVEGEEFDPVVQVNLTEPHDLARLVSEENLELLTAIVEHEPETITELADYVERDYKSVHRNLSELVEFGTVELQTTGRGKRPTLRAQADELELEVSVGGSDVDGDVHRQASG